MISADGRSYFFNEDSVTTAIKPGRKYTELARNRLDGGLLSTPAVSGDKLFVRTRAHLYRIEEMSSEK